MKKLLAGIGVASVILCAVFVPPAQAAGEKWMRFTKYQEGSTAIIYGDRYAIWDCWDNNTPTFLYVKDGGWQQVAKATVAKVSCPKNFPYRHAYRWTVDVLGPQDAAGDYYLEFAIGTSKNRYPVRVQEFTSQSDQINTYLCILQGILLEDC